MPPTMRSMVARRAGSFMATMIITASFRCMYSVATSCWSVICEGAKSNAAKHAWAILSLLVERFRQVWPKVRIIFRGDSGFSRWRMMRWCDRHNVGYIIGQAKNRRLNQLSATFHEQAAVAYAETKEKQRLFTSINYGAGSWDKTRRVIVKAEHTQRGSNPRYVVTN